MLLIKLATAGCLLAGLAVTAPVNKRQQAIQSYQQIANTTVDTIVNDFRTNGDVTVLRGLIDIAFAALESEAAIVASCLSSSRPSRSSNDPATPATPAPMLNSIASMLGPGPVINPSQNNALPGPTTSSVSSGSSQSTTPSNVLSTALSNLSSTGSSSTPSTRSSRSSTSLGMSSTLPTGMNGTSSMLSPFRPSTLSTVLNSANSSNSLSIPQVGGTRSLSVSFTLTPMGSANTGTQGAGLLSVSSGGLASPSGAGLSNVGTGVVGSLTSNLLGVTSNLLPASSGVGLPNVASGVIGSLTSNLFGITSNLPLSANMAGIGLGAGGSESSTCTDLICLGASASSLLSLNAGILPTSGAVLTNLASVGLGLLGGSQPTPTEASGASAVTGAFTCTDLICISASLPGLLSAGVGLLPTSGANLGNLASVGLGLLGGNSQPALSNALDLPGVSSASGLVFSAANGAVATCTDLICVQASLPGLLSLSGGVLPTSGANLGNLLNVGVGILGGAGSPAEVPAVTTPIASLVSAASQVSSAASGCGDLICLQASLPGLISVSAGLLPTSGANLGNLLGVGLNLFNKAASPTTLSVGTTRVVASPVVSSMSVLPTSGATHAAAGAARTGSWIPVTSWVYIGGL